MPDQAPQSSSSLTSAAARANRWAAANPGHEPVLVIASDGALDDFDSAFAELAAFPGPVYVLALGGLPPEWIEPDIAGQVTLTDTVEFGDIARSLADLLNAPSLDSKESTS
jgi:hypothetical protein